MKHIFLHACRRPSRLTAVIITAIASMTTPVWAQRPSTTPNGAAPIVVSTPSKSTKPLLSLHASLAEMPAGVRIPSRIEDLFVKGKIPRHVDTLSVPAVKVRSGGNAVISVRRDFKVEGKGNIECGVMLTIKPVWRNGLVIYTGEFSMTEFDGFAEHSTGKAPVLSIKKVIFDGSVEPGKTAWIAFPSRIQKSTTQWALGQTGIGPKKTEYKQMKLLIALSFERI